MNYRLSEIVNEIEDARRTLLNTVEGLSQKEFDEQPVPGKWSVGEILHHIYLMETQVTKLLAKQVEKAREFWEKIGFQKYDRVPMTKMIKNT